MVTSCLCRRVVTPPAGVDAHPHACQAFLRNSPIWTPRTTPPTVPLEATTRRSQSAAKAPRAGRAAARPWPPNGIRPIATPGRPKRWVVERGLAWLTAHRRLARDYERDPAVSEAFIRWAAGPDAAVAARGAAHVLADVTPDMAVLRRHTGQWPACQDRSRSSWRSRVLVTACCWRWVASLSSQTA